MEDRRHPIRPLDPAVLQPLLGGRELRSAEPFPSGKSNTNYKLLLGTGETFVLRLLAFPRAAQERYVLGLVRDIVPVPDVLEFGDDWLILSFLEGHHLSDLPGATHLAAETLARISSIKFDLPGWIGADGQIEPFDFGNEEGFVPTMLGNQVVRGWLGDETFTRLASILEREEQSENAPPERPCLCHGDFNPTNILLHNGRISGILDWEFAHSGDLYMDLGNLLRHTPPGLQKELRSGCAAGGLELPDDWQRRAEFTDLSSHLEFLTSQRSDSFKAQCVEWVRRFVAKYSAFASCTESRL